MSSRLKRALTRAVTIPGRTAWPWAARTAAPVTTSAEAATRAVRTGSGCRAASPSARLSPASGKNRVAPSLVGEGTGTAGAD
ncbi:MAG: hypothetical protein VKS61_13700 [Candidatus Sericytochromatia bacterium]|nr:hypothetical protein [Candidatus Sericytochromatia bacterium]